MTPFLMKHTQNYMLENQDMQAVASLGKGKQALREEVSGIGGAPKEPKEPKEEDQLKENEMN